MAVLFVQKLAIVMQDHRIYELIARKLSGSATPAELTELSNHLQQDAGDQYLYELLATWWAQHPGLLSEESADEEERFQRILHAVDESPPVLLNTEIPQAPVRSLSWKKWMAVAAAVIVLAGTIIFFRYNSPEKPPVAVTPPGLLNEIVARAGSKSKLVLPDGTQVWLNAATKITYPYNFNSQLREVHLEGEAFFDVTHDEQRPFIVHTSGIDIKVLGTAFNVKSYAADATIEATLLRGSIEVVRKNDHNASTVILRPHEKLVFNKAIASGETVTGNSDQLQPAAVQLPEAGISVTGLQRNQPDSSMKETAWVYNKLIFDGDSFQELAEKMERWYNVRITIHIESLKQLRLKGIFDNETIGQALDALKLTAPFEYSIHGDEIEIFR